MRTKGESPNCQSREKVILCGQYPSPGWCCCHSVSGTWAAPEQNPPVGAALQPVPAAGTNQMPAVSSPAHLLPPAAGARQRCCTADRVPYAGASAPDSGSPCWPGHCWGSLRQSRLLLTLHTAARGLGRSGAQPGAKMGVPAGLFRNKTSTLLLTVLCTAIPLVGYLCWHP